MHGSPAGRRRAFSSAHKTDRADACGIAQILRFGWFSPVHMKSRKAPAIRALLTSRKAIQRKCTNLGNEIRRLLRVL
ncbi:MAG: IS110 family transposase [Paracoccus sp. (in: a-proteobacteria)]|uniref:IS110 family transposase n=1 Tax=Paracoccus sp. TaxID=267 RepID=UPI0040591A5C